MNKYIFVGLLLLASGSVLAGDQPQLDTPICGETHCCIQFDTPNGGLVECYERDQAVPKAQQEEDLPTSLSTTS